MQDTLSSIAILSDCCSSQRTATSSPAPKFRVALWVALVVNAAMFGVEITAGVHADSAALLADAADFLGDAANYGLSLFVLALAPIWRSRAALVKGVSMGAYGVGVLGLTAYNLGRGALPEATTMGAVGILALCANATVALILHRFRRGDANMRSVWLCSRNDAIGNAVVVLGALGVFGTGSAWPDLLVAAIMATLGLTAAVQVVRQAVAEIRGPAPRLETVIGHE